MKKLVLHILGVILFSRMHCQTTWQPTSIAQNFLSSPSLESYKKYVENNNSNYQNILSANIGSNGTGLSGTNQFINLLVATNFYVNGTTNQPNPPLTNGSYFDSGTNYKNSIDAAIYNPCCNQTLWQHLVENYNTFGLTGIYQGINVGSQTPLFCNLPCVGTSCQSCTADNTHNNCAAAVSYYSNNYTTFGPQSSGTQLQFMPQATGIQTYYQLADKYYEKCPAGKTCSAVTTGSNQFVCSDWLRHHKHFTTTGTKSKPKATCANYFQVNNLLTDIVSPSMIGQCSQFGSQYLSIGQGSLNFSTKQETGAQPASPVSPVSNECQKGVLCLSYQTQANFEQLALNDNVVSWIMANSLAPTNSAQTDFASNLKSVSKLEQVDDLASALGFAAEELLTVLILAARNIASLAENLDYFVNNTQDAAKLIAKIEGNGITKVLQDKWQSAVESFNKQKSGSSFSKLIEQKIAVLQPQYQSVTPQLNMADYLATLYRDLILQSYIHLKSPDSAPELENLIQNFLGKIYLYYLANGQTDKTQMTKLKTIWFDYAKNYLKNQNESFAANSRSTNKIVTQNVTNAQTKQQALIDKVAQGTQIKAYPITGTNQYNLETDIFNLLTNNLTKYLTINVPNFGSQTVTLGSPPAIVSTAIAGSNVCPNFLLNSINQCIVGQQNAQQAQILQNLMTMYNGALGSVNSPSINFILCALNNVISPLFSYASSLNTVDQTSNFFNTLLAKQFACNSTSGTFSCGTSLTGSVTSMLQNFDSSIVNYLYNPCCNAATWQNIVKFTNPTSGTLSMPLFCQTPCTGTNCLALCSANTSANTTNSANCNNAVNYFANGKYTSASGTIITFLPYGSNAQITLTNLVGSNGAIQSCPQISVGTKTSGTQAITVTTTGSGKQQINLSSVAKNSQQNTVNTECQKALTCLNGVNYYNAQLQNAAQNVGNIISFSYSVLLWNIAKAFNNWQKTPFSWPSIKQATTQDLALVFGSNYSSSPYYQPTAVGSNYLTSQLKNANGAVCTLQSLENILINCGLAGSVCGSKMDSSCGDFCTNFALTQNQANIKNSQIPSCLDSQFNQTPACAKIVQECSTDAGANLAKSALSCRKKHPTPITFYNLLDYQNPGTVFNNNFNLLMPSFSYINNQFTSNSYVCNTLSAILINYVQKNISNTISSSLKNLCGSNLNQLTSQVETNISNQFKTIEAAGAYNGGLMAIFMLQGMAHGYYAKYKAFMRDNPGKGLSDFFKNEASEAGQRYKNLYDNIKSLPEKMGDFAQDFKNFGKRAINFMDESIGKLEKSITDAQAAKTSFADSSPTAPKGEPSSSNSSPIIEGFSDALPAAVETTTISTASLEQLDDELGEIGDEISGGLSSAKQSGEAGEDGVDDAPGEDDAPGADGADTGVADV